MRFIALVLMASMPIGAAHAQNSLVQTYQKLCDGGDAFYCQALGNIFNEGRDVPVDKAKAASAYLKACDGNAKTACLYAANLYAAGDGVAKDANKATALYKRGCDLNDADSCKKIALPDPQSAKSAGSPQQAPKSQVAASPPSTAQGTPPAAADLPKDPKEVLALAQGGNAAAQNRVGFWYEKGTAGFRRNPDEALSWYLKAANRNDAYGMYNVCRTYDRKYGIGSGLFRPDGVPIKPFPIIQGPEADISAALSWCLKAAETHDFAWDTIAEIYARGWNGTQPDYARAYRWARHGSTLWTALGEQLTPAQRKEIDDKYKPCGDLKCEARMRLAP